MVIFGPNSWVNPMEKCQFFEFLNFSFYRIERRFLVLEYHKKTFSCPILPKKKVGKMAIFGPKPWANPFRKMSIFRLYKLLVFKGQKSVFFFLGYHKRHFPALYFLKKVGKRAIFGPKLWVNPFSKTSIFRFFKLLVFIAQKGVFSFQNLIKDNFQEYIAKKKKLEKWPFQDQNHGLTPMEKCQFSTV